jgi:predicted nucleic acid-binding protein
MSSRAPIKVFVDSDVVISSLISTSGAAYGLLHDTEQVELYVSNMSSSELVKVVVRPHLKLDGLLHLISTRLHTVNISQSGEIVRRQFAKYVNVIDDAHIVAGAKEARVAFLISYNIRDFGAEKLRQDFQIILLTPGMFLQYLRSL